MAHNVNAFSPPVMVSIHETYSGKINVAVTKPKTKRGREEVLKSVEAAVKAKKPRIPDPVPQANPLQNIDVARDHCVVPFRR